MSWAGSRSSAAPISGDRGAMSPGATLSSARWEVSEASELTASVVDRFSPGHASAGHRRVIGSRTSSRYWRSSSVNRLRGQASRSGARISRGPRRPLSRAGTAAVVWSATVVAFGYQVPSRASRAKFGTRPASIRPSGPSSDAVGSSSMTTITIGAGRLAAVAGLATGEPRGTDARNSTSTTGAAGARKRAKLREVRERRSSTRAPAPQPQARATSSQPGKPRLVALVISSASSFSSPSAIAVSASSRRPSCRREPHPERTVSATRSASSASSGGPKAMARAKITTAAVGVLRAEKNSGEWVTTENSGCARARV